MKRYKATMEWTEPGNIRVYVFLFKSKLDCERAMRNTNSRCVKDCCWGIRSGEYIDAPKYYKIENGKVFDITHFENERFLGWRHQYDGTIYRYKIVETANKKGELIDERTKVDPTIERENA